MPDGQWGSAFRSAAWRRFAPTRASSRRVVSGSMFDINCGMWVLRTDRLRADHPGERSRPEVLRKGRPLRAWSVLPATIVALGAVTVTVLTDGETAMSTVLDAPPPVAVIVAVPGATAVIKPDALTVATDALEVDQVKVTPLTV